MSPNLEAYKKEVRERFRNLLRSMEDYTEVEGEDVFSWNISTGRLEAFLSSIIDEVEERTRAATLKEVRQLLMREAATFPDAGAGPSHDLAVRMERLLDHLSSPK